MKTPFENDMFSFVFKAFKKLYPHKKFECAWEPEPMKSKSGQDLLGLTTFYDDGSATVDISIDLKIMDAVEILKHELAHVAVGYEENHGPKWQKAFDKIQREANKIANKKIGEESVVVNVISGKSYVGGDVTDP